MVAYELEVISKYVIEIGLWKFYFLSFGILVALIMNILEKEKGKLRKLAIISLGGLFIINILFIILAHINS